jgi:hypothetical protein
MKGFTGAVWDIVRTVLAGLILLWLSKLSLDGLFSTAIESTKAFKEWLYGPLVVARWNILSVLVLATVSAVGFIAAYISSNWKSQKALKAVSDLTEGLTDAAHQAIEMLAGPSDKPTYPDISGPGLQQVKNIELAMELTQLDTSQIKLMRFFAPSIMRGSQASTSNEAAMMTGTSMLRTAQKIDQLVSLGMLNEHQYPDKSGKCYSLSPAGREWLLANGHE